MIEVGGVGYEPMGEFTMGGRVVTPRGCPAVSTLLEAACLCNNAVLANNATGGDSSSLRQVLQICEETEHALGYMISLATPRQYGVSLKIQNWSL